MFTEIIKLTPQIDRSALTKMFRDLNTRFANAAKKFGSGLKNAMKFGLLAGGPIALLAGLTSKLLNPLQKAEELIDKVTGKGDDAVTNAEEFGSDPGKLLRLEALAAAKGLDANTLRTLLGKFQSRLAVEKEAAAAAKPAGKEAPTGRLSEFLDETDMADAFFKFVQSLQGLDKPTQTVIQNEIFGEQLRGKAAEFFNAKDFAEILAQLPSAELLGEAARKSGELSDLKDLLKARREAEDFITKSTLIDESQIRAIDESERRRNIADNESLIRFDSLKQSNIAIQELTHKFDRFATDFITNVAPEVVKGVRALSKFSDEFLPSFQEVKEVITTGFTLIDEKLDEATTVAAEFWVKGEEIVGGAIDNVKSVANAVSSVWGEFKTSKIYRTFGGKP